MQVTSRGVLSVAISLVGLILLGVGLNRILDAGSCASGGSVVIARPCPDGTNVWIVFMVVGFVVWMAGLLVSKGGLAEPGAGQVVWTLGFAGGGAALLLKVLTQPSLPPDAKLGIGIVAALFIPMGLTVGIVGLVQLSRRRRPGPSRATAAPHPNAPMKRLNRLRSTGALTRAEFDQLKQSPATDKLDLIQQLADLKRSGVLTAEEFEAKKQTVLSG